MTTRARLRASLSTSGENGVFGAVVASAVAGYGLVAGGSVAGIATISRWGGESGEGPLQRCERREKHGLQLEV